MGARSVFREVLRAVDKHITSVSGNTLWRDAVIDEFRRHRNLNDPVLIERELSKATDYAALICNIAHHKKLLVEYNIGIESDERNRRMVEATARRVGFELPHRTNHEDTAAPVNQSQQEQEQQQEPELGDDPAHQRRLASVGWVAPVQQQQGQQQQQQPQEQQQEQQQTSHGAAEEATA